MEEDGTVSPTVKSMDFLQRVADLGFPVAEIPAYADRVGSFRDYAKAMGAGTIMAPPVLLSGRLRKLHVRNTIIEDHAMRMHLIPEAVEGKLRDLAASPFSFFRGTALLYYRDWAGTDAHLPSVASVGDVHPENFGLVPGTHGGALFTPNDFDEAWYAPFTYDVYRGDTGFALAGYEMGLKRKRWLRIAETFAEGYIRGVEKCAGNPEESQRRIVADNAPKVLKPFFDKAERSREKFLDKRIDRDAQQFLEDERVARRPEFIPMIQQAINRYRNVQDTEDYFTVLDVATRTGSGTASRGLPRFWALVRGDDQPVIMELKMSRPSALEGLVPVERETTQSPAERTASIRRLSTAAIPCLVSPILRA